MDFQQRWDTVSDLEKRCAHCMSFDDCTDSVFLLNAHVHFVSERANVTMQYVVFLFVCSVLLYDVVCRGYTE